MTKKTSKQKRQEEEYKKIMSGRRAEKSEQFFKKSAEIHVQKHCSVCNHHWAWYSNDFGESWQCAEHRKRAV